jgi:hypothetical protein
MADRAWPGWALAALAAVHLAAGAASLRIASQFDPQTMDPHAVA